MIKQTWNAQTLQSGFTLIELLVVVLIIGILSAVALPQYEMAVKKTRFTSLFPIVETLVKAQEVYYMANGEYAMAFSQLDIDPPGGGVVVTDNGAERINYKNYYCRLFGSAVYCHGPNHGYYSVYMHHAEINPDTRFCVVETTYQDAAVRRKMCRSLGGVKIRDGQFEFWQLP